MMTMEDLLLRESGFTLSEMEHMGLAYRRTLLAVLMERATIRREAEEKARMEMDARMRLGG